MLHRTDDYCRVINESETAIIEARKALESVSMPSVNIDEIIAAERMEVRKYKSGRPGMDNCAIVKLGKDYWGIPRHVLTLVPPKR